jgi:hypothetical protein
MQIDLKIYHTLIVWRDLNKLPAYSASADAQNIPPAV